MLSLASVLAPFAPVFSGSTRVYGEESSPAFSSSPPFFGSVSFVRVHAVLELADMVLVVMPFSQHTLQRALLYCPLLLDSQDTLMFIVYQVR